MAEFETYIKKMDEELERAVDEKNTLGDIVYFGDRAICWGLTAIAAELSKLRMQLKENGERP